MAGHGRAPETHFSDFNGSQELRDVKRASLYIPREILDFPLTDTNRSDSSSRSLRLFRLSPWKLLRSMYRLLQIQVLNHLVLICPFRLVSSRATHEVGVINLHNTNVIIKMESRLVYHLISCHVLDKNQVPGCGPF